MTVLSGLLESPIGALGEVAVSRIRAEEEARERSSGVSSDDGPDELRRRGYRQLDVADFVIRSLIKREIELMERLSVLAEQFRIADVLVAPANEQALLPGVGFDQLLSPSRMGSFRQFLEVWHEVARNLRSRWELRGGG